MVRKAIVMTSDCTEPRDCTEWMLVSPEREMTYYGIRKMGEMDLGDLLRKDIDECKKRLNIATLQEREVIALLCLVTGHSLPASLSISTQGVNALIKKTGRLNSHGVVEYLLEHGWTDHPLVQEIVGNLPDPVSQYDSIVRDSRAEPM